MRHHFTGALPRSLAYLATFRGFACAPDPSTCPIRLTHLHDPPA